MKSNTIAYTIALLTIITSDIAYAVKIENSSKAELNNLPLSPIVNSQSKKLGIDDELLSCKTSSTHKQVISSRIKHANENRIIPKSLKYLNDAVKATYNTMRNGVINYVTMKVALSLFNFNRDGFAAENLATYVSDGTKPFLPFKFANGVKITEVIPKGGTIVYRAEMPIAKNHSNAAILALEGRKSATTTVCNDIKIVDDLLGRNITIQYDYYDSNGVFFSSFTING